MKYFSNLSSVKASTNRTNQGFETTQSTINSFFHMSRKLFSASCLTNSIFQFCFSHFQRFFPTLNLVGTINYLSESIEDSCFASFSINFSKLPMIKKVEVSFLREKKNRSHVKSDKTKLLSLRVYDKH